LTKTKQCEVVLKIRTETLERKGSREREFIQFGSFIIFRGMNKSENHKGLYWLLYR
jgi:hypothetical protein